MQSQGVSPDTVSYSTVIHACVRVQKPVRAEYWLNEMTRNNEPASAFCYNSVIQAWANANDVAKAEKWLSKAFELQVEVSGNSCNNFVNSCIRAGELKKAENRLTEMSRNGVASISSHNALAAAWARQGEYGRADAMRRR